MVYIPLIESVYISRQSSSLLNLDFDTDSVYFAAKLEARSLSAIAQIMCTSSPLTSKKERRAVHWAMAKRSETESTVYLAKIHPEVYHP